MASILFPTAAITLLLLVLSPSPSFAAEILDVDGDALPNGGEYYIVPHSPGKGGLTVTPAADSSPCPLFITHDDSSNSGSPVKISTRFRTIKFLRTSYPIEFNFERVSTTCNKPLRWWVAPSDANNKSYVLVGTDGPFKRSYSFYIKRAESGEYVYNIKFCHKIESEIFRVSAMECKDVRILDDGKLGVSEDGPFLVVFEKYYIPRIASYVN